jgi:phytoene dehydrogenase-like protein
LKTNAAAYDAIVVGSGPNGLAAAITIAQTGRRVQIREAQPSIGGAVSSAALTLPGYIHDRGSAIHPLGVGSPFFRTLPLADYGLRWIYSPAALAHPLDDGTAVMLERSVSATAANLGIDGAAYRRLMTPLVRYWNLLIDATLRPLWPPPLWPLQRPLALACFGLLALIPARMLAERCFRGERARALFGGLAGHSALPFETLASASFGLILGMLGHAVGWPFPQGGAQRLSDALAAHAQKLHINLVTNAPVRNLRDLPPTNALLLDLTPRQVLALAGDQLPDGYRRALGRYRYGPGAFKIDWALDGPLPWRAATCQRAATVHLGGTLAEMATSERLVGRGEHPNQPYVLLSQPSVFDPSRAPAGKHTVWAYCHVPNGSTVDMTARIEAQIERFAPGFTARILARHVSGPTELEQGNANLVGGDVGGGAQNLAQMIARPTLSPGPYRTPLPGVYLCSSSTPPGGGVHGMCGHLAALAALHDNR